MLRLQRSGKSRDILVPRRDFSLFNLLGRLSIALRERGPVDWRYVDEKEVASTDFVQFLEKLVVLCKYLGVDFGSIGVLIAVADVVDSNELRHD